MEPVVGRPSQSVYPDERRVGRTAALEGGTGAAVQLTEELGTQVAVRLAAPPVLLPIAPQERRGWGHTLPLPSTCPHRNPRAPPRAPYPRTSAGRAQSGRLPLCRR